MRALPLCTRQFIGTNRRIPPDTEHHLHLNELYLNQLSCHHQPPPPAVMPPDKQLYKRPTVYRRHQQTTSTRHIYSTTSCMSYVSITCHACHTSYESELSVSRPFQLPRVVICTCLCSWLCLSQLEHDRAADMELVKCFTQVRFPNFNFTRKKHVNRVIFGEKIENIGCFTHLL